jgi:hypothetical protein
MSKCLKNYDALVPLAEEALEPTKVERERHQRRMLLFAQVLCEHLEEELAERAKPGPSRAN